MTMVMTKFIFVVMIFAKIVILLKVHFIIRDTCGMVRDTKKGALILTICLLRLKMMIKNDSA